MAKKKRNARVPKEFPQPWRKILLNRVAFYRDLSQTNREKFEGRILEFLRDVVITPVDTSIDIEDKLLVAASGIIPIFYLTDHSYPNLREVLIYPNTFNLDHETQGHFRNVAGMVGNGYMQGTMILSKSHLIGGFMNSKDGQNTAIHEFMHLVDGWDGWIDGVPQSLMNKAAVLPWMEGVRQGMIDIKKRESKLDSYGATNPQEFFAVVGEYFFEKPQLLKTEHPEIYEMLQQMFRPGAKEA